MTEALAKPNAWTPQTDLSKLGLKVRSVADIESKGFCTILYGAPGMGKTTMIGQLSNTDIGGKVFILDIEGGPFVLSHDPSIEVVEIESFEQAKAVFEAFNAMKDIPYGTIAVDVLTELAKRDLAKIAGGGQPQIQHYGDLQRHIVTLVRMGSDLARRKGVNVIFTAWEDRNVDASTSIVLRQIDFTKGVRNDLVGIVDYIIRLTMESGKRIVDMQTDERTDAKFRRAKTPNQQRMPMKFPYTLEDTVLADIARTIKNDAPFPVEKYIKPKEK